MTTSTLVALGYICIYITNMDTKSNMSIHISMYEHESTYNYKNGSEYEYTYVNTHVKVDMGRTTNRYVNRNTNNT